MGHSVKDLFLHFLWFKLKTHYQVQQNKQLLSVARSQNRIYEKLKVSID